MKRQCQAKNEQLSFQSQILYLSKWKLKYRSVIHFNIVLYLKTAELLSYSVGEQQLYRTEVFASILTHSLLILLVQMHRF